MSEEVKGVFVRLPLSEAQALLYLRESQRAWDESKDLSSAIACESSLLAIGTPVAGGELEVVCSIDEDILRDIRELDEDDEEYVTDMLFKPNPEGVDTAPLVRQSDAQAVIAATQVEIVRLREALEGLENANNNLCFMRSSDTYQSMMRDGCGDFLAKLDDARRAAREALKGGAA